MRVRSLKTFLDADAGCYRTDGEVFEVTPERLRGINSTRYGTLAEQVEEPPSEDVSAPQRAKRTRRTKE